MKVVKIDFENKTFFTEDGDEYPLMFGIDENITLEEFQKILVTRDLMALLASFSGKYYGKRSLDRRKK